ncbi:MBL fold metallo-hydrolase [Nocardioides sambongensis]|uniref:MBL fold metallo-hydrolase n=1 Tax=Nocardioides sambongensis TaxID=2589074 RepID=UPI0011294C23|nr:MBL fold metallo-hydrolase [Nocardioides sambongensis]
MNLRVHHLDCGTMRPAVAPRMVAHVLLVERPDGLLLVDTGFGTGDIADPGRLGAAFRLAVRPDLDPGRTALAQVRARGLDPADVTDIAVTHLDLDHAGGLADFPEARVHVHAAELEAALRPRPRERARYVADQWAHGPRWATYPEAGEEWFGFAAVTALADDVVLVPLPGHTRGHSGLAVRRADGHWLLHAGDAFFHRGQLAAAPTCPATLTAFQGLMAVDNTARRANVERLRELALRHHDEVTVVCAHDAEQLRALQRD